MGRVLGRVYGRRKTRERKMLGLEGGGDGNWVMEEKEEGRFGYDDAALVPLPE